jgi:hypothetical protein
LNFKGKSSVLAKKYAKENGISLKRQSEYAEVDPERAKEMGENGRRRVLQYSHGEKRLNKP